MTTERDLRIENLFAEALEVSELERTAWLAEACGGDQELFAEVDSLLKAYAMAQRVLKRSILDGL